MSAQSFVSSLLNRFSPARTRPLQRSSRRRSVGCEQLEPRQLLSAITVNVWHDRSDPNDQWTTLREAVEMANADPATADTITFPSNFSYRDVTLIQGQLTLEGNVTIDASAAGLVRIRRHDRAPAARVLEVAPGADVDIRNVVVEGGVLANQHGAGIYNAGQLDLFDSIVGGNELREASRSSRAGKRFSISGGAGIYNAPAGLLTLHNSRVGAVPVDSDLLTELNIDPTRFRDSTTGQTYFVQPNIASGIGGGILNEGTASLLDGSAVHGNRSWFGGGGIYNAGRMTLTASTVSSNTDGYNASNGLRLGSDGTGIRNSDRVRTEFSHALQGTVGAGYTDRATAYGGTPELTITQSSISDHSGWRGAGIYNEHVTLTVRQSTIENNTVNARHDEHGNLGYSGGGAIYVNGGTVNLFQSTLANNAALSAAAGDPISAGGAVFAEGVRTVVSETSTFSGNSADRGGAIYSATDPTGKSRALILLQSTLTANTATMAGGGIWLSGQRPGVMARTIVAGNTAPTDPSIAASDMLSGGHNLVGPVDPASFVAAASDIINVADPGLGPLGDFGGPTRTHALLANSPAVDAIADSAQVRTDEDQRGLPRHIGPAVDIGAFESEPPGSLRVDTLSDIADGDYSPGQLSLREAIQWAKRLPGPDTVGFADSLVSDIRSSETGAATIQLASTLVLDDDVSIVGPGANVLSISGDDRFRVIEVAADATVGLHTLTIRDGRLTDASGAGILNSGHLTLTDAIVTENEIRGTSGHGAGIFNNHGSSLLLDSSSVHHNTTVYAAGGIYFRGDVTIVNSTISNNTARQGGAFYGHQGTARIENSTITENRATEFGGAIRNWATVVTVSNSVIAGNAAPAAPEWSVTFDDRQISGGNNLLGIGTLGFADGENGDIVGSALAPIDPLLGSLSAAGAALPVHRPLPNSPVIDAGSSTSVLVDQLDTVRGADGPPEIGAVEYSAPQVPATLVVDSDAGTADGDFSPGNLQLSEAILLAALREGPDEIRFASHLTGRTLPVGSRELVLDSDVIIVGPDDGFITIDGQQQTRLFRVEPGVNAELRRLVLTGGAPGAGNAQPGEGGAIRNAGTLTISDVFLTENSTDTAAATADGGAIFNAGSLTIGRSTLSANTAERGGAIFNAGTLAVTNSTLSGNRATVSGGHLHNETGQATLTSATVVDGVSGKSGGGGIHTAAAATVTLTNTIVARNDDNTAAGDVDTEGTAITGGGNLIGTSSANLGFTPLPTDQVGTTLITVDPGLTSLVISNSELPVHVPIPGSRAIDAAIAGVPADQRQVARPQGAMPDVGAVEAETFTLSGPLVVDNLSDQLNGDYSPGDLTLREAILLANVLDAGAGPDILRFSPAMIDSIAASQAGTADIRILDSRIDISDDLIIEDPAAHRPDVRGTDVLTISGGGLLTIFQIDVGVTADIRGLHMADGGGRPGTEWVPSIHGGAIRNRGTLTLTDVLIENSSGARGGAIETEGVLNLRDSILRNNHATSGGGALWTSYDSQTHVFRSVITSNSTDNGQNNASGGGVFSDGTLEIVRSEISANTANSAGGGIFSAGSLDVDYSTISGNTVTESGSAGGGISSTGQLNLQQTTVAENSAVQRGGGLDVIGITTLTSTLIAGNTAATNPDGSGVVVAGNSLSATAGFLPSGNGNLVANPHLGPLANNGGSTRTHQIRPGSPAIDAGRNTTAIVDQRGRSLVDIVGTGSGIPDIGAYEVQSIGSSAFEYDVYDQSQFGPGDALVYGFGFDDGRATSSVSSQPQFLGFEFDTGNLKAGHIATKAFDSKYGGEINADFAGKLGFDIGFYVNSGSLDVGFDGDHKYIVDTDSTGATISNFLDITDGSLYTVSPKIGAYADLVMQLRADVSATGCFVGCASRDLLSLDFDRTLELFSMNRQMRDFYKRAMFFAVGEVFVQVDGEYVDASGGVFARAANGNFYDLADKTTPIDFYELKNGTYTRLSTAPVVPFLDGDIRYVSVQLIVENSLNAARTAQEFKNLIQDELSRRKAAAQLEDAREKQNQAAQDLDRLHDQRAAAMAAQEGADTAGDWLKQREKLEQLDRDITSAEDKLIEAASDRKRVEDEVDKNHKRRNGKRKLKSPTQFIQVEFSEAEGSLLGAQADLVVGVGATTPVGNIGASLRVGSMQVTLPDINLGTNTTDANGVLTASTSAFPAGSEQDQKRQLADLKVDLATLLGTYFGLPLGQYNVSLGPLSLDLTTVSYDLGPQLNVTQDIRAEPVVEGMTYQFFTIEQGDSLDHDDDPSTPDLVSGYIPGDPVSVDVEIDGVTFNNVTSVQFAPDQNVRVLNTSQPILVAPSLTMDTRVTNDIGLEVAVRGEFEAFGMALSAFGYDVVNVEPLLNHKHTLGTFDLGSVFRRTFETDNPQVVDLAPFTLFQSFTDGRTAATALEPAPAAGRPNRTYPEYDMPANQNVFVRVDMLEPEAGRDGADRFYPTLKVTTLRGEAPALVQVTDDRLSVVPTATGFEIRGFTSEMLDETQSVTFAMLFDTPGVRKLRTQRWAAVDLIPETSVTENSAAINEATVQEITAAAVLTTDIDGDGVSSAQTDGLLFQRYVQGLRDERLTDGAVGENARRTTPEAIAAFIGQSMSYRVTVGDHDYDSLDFDGNQRVDQFDATLFTRYVSGLRGSALVDGAIGPNAARTRSREIVSYIERERADVSDRNNTALDDVMQTTDDIFELDRVFDIADAVAGSSSYSGVSTPWTGSISKYELSTYRQRVRFEELYYQTTVPKNLLSRAAENNPTEFGPARQDLLDIDANHNGVADVFEIGLPDEKLVRRVFDRRIGESEPIFITHRDGVGHDYQTETGHLFESVSIDRRVNGNLLLGSKFDIFVYEAGAWRFETTLTAADSVRDGLLEYTFPSPVQRFRVYSAALPNEELFGSENIDLPHLEVSTGFRIIKPTGVRGKPVVRIRRLGQREAITTPDRIATPGPHPTDGLFSDMRITRSQSVVHVEFDGQTTTLPISATRYADLAGNDATDDTLTLDGSGGPLQVPIHFDGGFRNDRILVEGSDISLDFTADDSISGVELIDIAGNGQNSLIVDLEVVRENDPVSRTLRVIRDTDDKFVRRAGWSRDGQQIEDGIVFKRWIQADALLLLATRQPSAGLVAPALLPPQTSPGDTPQTDLRATDMVFSSQETDDDDLFS